MTIASTTSTQRSATTSERVYFAAVGILALWVAFWGLFHPADVDNALPWLVPPLHARFIGAIYLAAVVLTALGVRSRCYLEARIIAPYVTIWTGGLLIVSLAHFDEFDFAKKPPWFWFGAYIAYPIIGAWMTWRDRRMHERATEPPLPTWIQTMLIAVGAVLIPLSVALLVAPGAMSRHWPWKISSLLAQIYGSPVLAFGICCLILARARSWIEARLFVWAGLAGAVAMLVGSTIHRSLFSASKASSWAWFGGLLALGVGFGAACVSSVSVGRRA